MITRYPHTAIITLQISVELVNGKRTGSNESTIVIIGRYDVAGGNGQSKVKVNSLGKEVVVHGEFYTKVSVPKTGKPLSIKIDSLSIESEIICWETFQTHSVISI